MLNKAISSCLYFFKFILAGVTALFLLSVFCFFYSYSGVHIENKTGATDYFWYPNQLKSTMTEGFAWLHIDKNGFNNLERTADEADKNIDILLMGSSHMEAIMIPVDENVGALLNIGIPELTTYNIGMSGHTVYNNVNNIENAVKKFDPKKYIILETSSISLNSDKMKSVLDGSFKRIPSYDSGLIFLVQKNIPAVKSLYKQIDVWKNTNNILNKKSDVITKQTAGSDNYSQLLGAFLKKASDAAVSNGGKLILFYHPISQIDEKGDMVFATDNEDLKTFKKACNKNGIIFVDMTNDFYDLYKKEHILPNGFINSGVGIGHLNKYGEKIIAQRLINVIKTDIASSDERANNVSE